MLRHLAWLALSGLMVTQVQAPKITAMTPDPNGPRVIDAVDTVFIEDLTWMEVRDALKAGKKTVLVATGGVEQNGPYLVTGKHNVVLKAMTESIARKLGNTLVAPIVGFVPEGDFDPPTEHMKYPGTVSVSEETFQALLRDICSSFKTHGFENIILIGDSGGNQKGMDAVAKQLNAKWGGKPKVHYIKEFANYPDCKKYLASQGIKEVDESLHDDFAITSIMATVDPNSIRYTQRVKANKATINSVSIQPLDKTVEWGKKVVDFRTAATIAAIKKSLGQ